MVVVGNQVKCVSEQLSGKRISLWFESFVEFLQGATIAYDYRDSMLWMFKDPYSTALVYSIKSGTFARFDFFAPIINAVNYYPDYLVQQKTTGKVYSLLNRKDINEDGTTDNNNNFTPNYYTARLISRPMKLENALALKSIMQVRHIHDFDHNTYTTSESNGQGGTTTVTHNVLQLRIFASNNLKSWVELHSLRGAPWKYYKFQYNFTNLIATDRFAGSVIVTQERRTNKMR